MRLFGTILNMSCVMKIFWRFFPVNEELSNDVFSNEKGAVKKVP